MRAAAGELQPLQDRIAWLDTEAQELLRRRVSESTVTDVEAMPYLVRFLATVKRELDRIAKDRTGTVRAADAKREEVLVAWKDLRSKALLRSTLLDRVRREALLDEQGTLDERATQDHLRRSRLKRRPSDPE